MENFKKEKLTINLVWANVFGIIILIPIALMYGLPYWWVWKDAISFSSINWLHLAEKSWIAVLCLIAGIVAHELIHGIVWAIYAKNGFQSIKFGVLWKVITPYCLCKEPLTVRRYIVGVIMPAIILGFLPAILAIKIGSLPLLFFAIFFTMASSGDFLVIYALRNERKDTLVEDHSSEAGCYVYRPVEY